MVAINPHRKAHLDGAEQRVVYLNEQIVSSRPSTVVLMECVEPSCLPESFINPVGVLWPN